MTYSTTDIRQFLAETFNDGELTDLCFDNFREVYNSFGSGMTKGQKIQLLIEYCDQHESMLTLLELTRKARPERFAKRFAPVTSDLRANVVAVCGRGGEIVGTGFVAGERLVLTCAHVVQVAGGKPGHTVAVRFHFGGQRMNAIVASEYWRPPESDDIAGLQLEADLPAGVAPALIGDTEGIAGHPFRAFGYPSVGEIEGIWATGKIEGMVTEEGRQLIQLSSPNLAQGMSGGPLSDETRQQVVGMVTAVFNLNATTKHRDTSFATPAETLREVCPILGGSRGSNR